MHAGDEIYLLDGSTAFIEGAELEKLAEPIKVYNLEVADYNTYFVGDNAVLVHNYTAESGNVYPEDQDYNYRDPNSGDFLHIHNTHSHGGVQPHTQYPRTNVSPDGVTHYNGGAFSPTDDGDYELLDF